MEVMNWSISPWWSISPNFTLAIISIYTKQNRNTGNPEAQAQADSIFTRAAISQIKRLRH